MSTLDAVPAAPEPTPSPEPPPASQSGLSPGLNDAQTRLGQAFKSAMGGLRRLRGRETHQPGALSYAQYGLLFGLADETALPASRLACLADLSPATTTQMLDHLESDGLVKRIRSVLDKRVVLVSLTDRGRELVEQRRGRWEGRWRAALDGFSETEILAAAAVLERLGEMFDGYERDQPPDPA
jgi:DNA-binding MarR family transcriptional regulator